MPANGVRTLRMSKKDHPMPKRENEQFDLSGLRGMSASGVTKNTGLDNGQQLKAPLKTRAFDVYERTGTPEAAENVDGGREGRVRGRQADKGSKSK